MKKKYPITKECVVWKKDISKWGYGRVWNKGKRYLAHRYFYTLRYGKIPKGLVIDHLCNNPSCVNPEHLKAVTQRKNVQRSRTAKLNTKKVLEIRNLYKTKTFNQEILSKMFGVGQDQISRIINRKRWA